MYTVVVGYVKLYITGIREASICHCLEEVKSLQKRVRGISSHTPTSVKGVR